MIKTYKFLFSLLIFSNMLFGDMVGSLSNKVMDISGFFFKSSKSIYFSVANDENNFSVWEYRADRTYKPIHNAEAFDGYKSADGIFDSMIIDKDYKSVRLTQSTNNDYNYLSSEKLDIVHILIKSSKYKLLVDNNLSSIWEYLDEGGRRYRPIHNAEAFDDYEGAKSIFNEIKLSEDSIKIRGINANNYMEFKQKELLFNKTKAIKIVKSKDYENNYEKLNDSLVKDKANNLIWFNDINQTRAIYSKAKEYCENIEVGDYKDFRIPNMLELMSLFDKNGKHKDMFNLYINKKTSSDNVMPPGMNSKSYFSNEATSQGRNKILLEFSILNGKTHFMKDDFEFSFFRENKNFIKCVQSEKPLSTAVLVRDDKKEIVKDITNNLMWQDDIGVRLDINKTKIENYCENFTLSGYKDWRSPTLKEIFISYQGNNELGIVNDFYNWTSYYTLINDSFSNQTQQYIIDNTYKISKSKNWDNGYGEVEINNMPQEVRDDMLNVLKFEKDTEFLTHINNVKEWLSTLEKKTEITEENYQDVLKKYKIASDTNKSKTVKKDLIPSGSKLNSLGSSSGQIFSFSDYDFKNKFFRDYYISKSLKEKLKDVEDIRYAEDKTYLMTRIENARNEIAFYKNKTNIENYFIYEKLKSRKNLRNSFNRYHFDIYFDIFKKNDDVNKDTISDGPILMLRRTPDFIRKICVRDNN